MRTYAGHQAGVGGLAGEAEPAALHRLPTGLVIRPLTGCVDEQVSAHGNHLRPWAGSPRNISFVADLQMGSGGLLWNGTAGVCCKFSVSTP